MLTSLCLFSEQIAVFGQYGFVQQTLFIDFSFFIFCPTQDPDNVIFVMDATIGQACEAQVNMMNQPLVMFYPHSLEFLLAYIAASLKGGLL